MKLTINNSNPESINDLQALSLVHQVVAGGLVSNFGKNYCYVTTFTNKGTNQKITVACDKTRAGNFSFRVWVT